LDCSENNESDEKSLILDQQLEDTDFFTEQDIAKITSREFNNVKPHIIKRSNYTIDQCQFLDDVEIKSEKLFTVHLCRIRTAWYKPYLHYYIIVELNEKISLYIGFNKVKGGFKVINYVWTKEIISHRKKLMGKELVIRLNKILNMENYSFVYRNCEHVARFLYDGIWFCSQMSLIHSKLGHLVFEEKYIDQYPEEIIKEYDSIKTKSPLLFKNVTRFKSILNQDHKNIIFFGPTGVGKSNLINHLSKTISCQSQRSPRSITQMVEFVECEGPSKTFNLIDTVGVNHSNDWESIFKAVTDRIGNKIIICQGWLVIKFSDRLDEVTKERVQTFYNWVKNNKRVEEYRIVFTHYSFTIDKEEKDRIKSEFLDDLKKMRIDNDFLFTMIDMVDDSNYKAYQRYSRSALSKRIINWINNLDHGEVLMPKYEPNEFFSENEFKV
jgi:GTP-binding protein EngB required for normal cell division